MIVRSGIFRFSGIDWLGEFSRTFLFRHVDSSTMLIFFFSLFKKSSNSTTTTTMISNDKTIDTSKPDFRQLVFRLEAKQYDMSTSTTTPMQVEIAFRRKLHKAGMKIQPWTCATCTYTNTHYVNICELCDSKVTVDSQKPSQVSPSPP
jgi:beta-galactosidase GanA